MKKRVLVLVSVVLVLAFASTAFAADVTVRITGLESGGEVRAALFASAADYDADRRAGVVAAAAIGDVVELVFSDVSPGTYGISVFLDMNANEELDKNFLRIPKERYGFSNNARGRFGPPDFEAFSFEVTDESLTIEIELR
ncbi:MAG: DUF2141 domain-containing protein [Dehalococcoidia bacterium]|jgi:uncharacterized protein (DUF2141 family)|nr:DUF2141 domain-containing protein [Dehalococcoidia bacterium]